MQENLLELIKQRGHWRINLRPVTLLAKKLTLVECREAAEISNVSLRGWDYPHIARRNSAESGYGNNDGFYENWTQWRTTFEFWRMYQSGQFLHYRNMWEDYEEAAYTPKRPFLSVEGVIYLFTEVAEFANRLATYGKFPEGIQISIAALGTTKRPLWAGRNRMPFSEPMTTEAGKVEVNSILFTDTRSIPPVDISNQLLMSFFDRFGWKPSHDQIRSDQERLLKRQF